ncbi:serine acetyltransferase [Gimesia sp.]|uniref:serine O-acetyltransferase n=1 Tax=Gimesia sp. TaxID=2024833 RepID=UPI000C62DFF1|nr:serine acetyltransferase [Gimesia sp.]MAX37852.1 serine acetyltransferase [Gimesia sp.]HAH48154.1 serine acetyltransferase [Planctomycetaceae bacterium]HBL46128.1 serine acetyltransferase [Planctomycetaceae bacterium]|tara:strand:+ start:8954 stop:9538 length:585 start_codon:yes stop_codon:yes gene_type:complete
MKFWEDLKAKSEWCYGNITYRSLLKTCLTDGTMAMLWYRLMQWSDSWKLFPLSMIFNKCNAIFCQCIIGRGASFGRRFVIIHSQGIVINGSVKAGDDIKLEHQVTIGAERNISPELGSDIFIGAGARIIGGIQLGSHSKVGANAVVVKNVDSYTTVGGIPARVIKIHHENQPVQQIEVNQAELPYKQFQKGSPL